MLRLRSTGQNEEAEITLDDDLATESGAKTILITNMMNNFEVKVIIEKISSKGSVKKGSNM